MAYQKGMAKIWVVLITIVVMGGLAGGGYYYLSSKHKKDIKALSDRKTLLEGELAYLKKKTESSPTAASSSTSSLKTYTNTTYGYQFQYPNADYLIDYLYDSSTSTKRDYGKIVMVDTKSIAENALKYASELPTPYFAVSATSDQTFSAAEITGWVAEDGGTMSDVTIDGVACWKVVATQPSVMDGTYLTTIYVNHGGYGITIFWKNDDASGAHDPAIDSIVSSFKWL